MKIYKKQLGVGTPLVLIHGWGFNSRVWEPLLATWGQHFQLILLDLPGFGLSETITAPMMSAEWISHIANQLPDEAMILGWSLGGLVATKLACLYPQKVSQIIYMAATAKFIIDDNWAGVSTGILQNFGNAIEDNPKKGLQQFCRWLAPDLSQRDLYKLLLSIANEHQDKKTLLIEALAVLKDSDLRHEQLNLSMPQRSIYGGKDPLVPYQQTMPDAHLIKQAGHVPFLTHTEECLRLLQEFCYVSG